MKKSILIAIGCCLFGSLAYGQTAIEKQTVDGDAVLDFAENTTKGIILPAVETLPATPANGTFLFDKNDATVKVYANSGWTNLSDAGDGTNVLAYTGTPNNKQTVIGSQSTTVDGVLVLEATDKALVLPKVASPHLNVPSPYPGMMCYDADAKALAVYDGVVWSYWK
ncbi:hypothetical protein NU10_13595 [Flavobacterium dauae]|uniref:hypothetical protein n=1 Tax=Flavobacterium dauae TaxID=1563479 RepID=UPI00101B4FC2|nr:hypothetical protein [Flavobacterium dauae]WLD23722.1 hypothetical protein NU10_13595 [Flavobacterium dauae]